MNAQLTQIAPIHVVMMRHVGSYDDVGPVFDTLWNWCEANRVPTSRTIGIYYDNPDFTPVNQLRAAACFEVPYGYQAPNTGGLAITVEDIPGGAFATTRFVGPYEKLAPVWQELTNYVERTLGKQISENPAFEVYVNDASETPPNQLITELYMPVV